MSRAARPPAVDSERVPGRITARRKDPGSAPVRVPTRAAIRGIVALAVLAAAGACGYSTRSLVLGGVNTVAVEMIENPTFRRDLEFRLLEDVKAAILSRTDLRIVEKSRADVILSGSIVNVREQVLSEDRVDNIVESSVIISVDFTLRDARSGETIRDARLTDRAEFLIGRGEDFNSATQESFSDLSERLVYRLLEEPF